MNQIVKYCLDLLGTRVYYLQDENHVVWISETDVALFQRIISL